MKFVLTGANSFIGAAMARRISEAGWESILVVRPGHRLEPLPHARILQLDMECYSELGKLAGPCDCFIHLAWNGTRGSARMDPELQNRNLRHSLRAVYSMLEAGCGKIVTAGSQAEYGPHNEQITESSRCIPNTEYGKAKLIFYEKTKALCTQNKVSYKEPRFFSLYGPRDYDGTMIMSVLRNMLADRDCELTQGLQLWDFLYIDDAIEGIFRLCKEPCPDGVYNFGSGDVRLLSDYVKEMRRVTHSNSNLLFGKIPYPDTGMVSLWPDVSKLKRELNWTVNVSFAKGIQRTVEWLQQSV